MLKELNNDQLKLLKEFKDSKLSYEEFAKKKEIKVHQISYLVTKQKKLEEQNNMDNEISFIKVPILENNTIEVEINGYKLKCNEEVLLKIINS